MARTYNDIGDTTFLRDVEATGVKGDSITLSEISTKTITTSFGRPEDYVELHIYNTADQLIFSDVNFLDFT